MAASGATEDRYDLAVVVLSHADHGDTIGAVGSLLAQDPPVHVVVSHSGGRAMAEALAARFPGVTLTVSDRLRLPGAARNAGIAATGAPFVAFLAADCRADPGWSAARLAHHRAGAAAVGSAIVPLTDGVVALASHVLQHSGRTAYLEAPPGFRFGASYSREVLAAHGPFPEELEFAEDVVLNRRLLAEGIAIEPAPEVITRHTYPGSIRALCRDEYRRARRRAGVRGQLGWRISLLARSLTIAPIGVWRVGGPGSTVPRRRLAAAVPLVLLGSVSAAAGSLRGGARNPGAEAEHELHLWLRTRTSPTATGRVGSRRHAVASDDRRDP